MVSSACGDFISTIISHLYICHYCIIFNILLLYYYIIIVLNILYIFVTVIIISLLLYIFVIYFIISTHNIE